MNFNTDKAIYIQIADRLCDEILAEELAEGARAPSVREYSALLEVNVNTTLKAYEVLSREEIIFNRRGMGYFIAEGAKERIRKERRKAFLEERLPQLINEMKLLGLSLADLRQALSAAEETA